MLWQINIFFASDARFMMRTSAADCQLFVQNVEYDLKSKIILSVKNFQAKLKAWVLKIFFIANSHTKAIARYWWPDSRASLRKRKFRRQLLGPLVELADVVNWERRQLDSNGFLLTEICFRLSLTTKLLNDNWNLMTYKRQLRETFSTFIPPSLTSPPRQLICLRVEITWSCDACSLSGNS